ncbi:bifunctional 2-polyprenyl-6-hydroxyphenol methylase/3-demethylubiquinol 3-O-methyltransferase UbiG [Actinotalea sp. K2]|uniref:class I SAM-dependent methyltransferase n=1 Tax=Actinotalea sp. K2 TaxID=2939438 RepID=UPI002017BAEF|nr:methyltransferase domain-containing protein [Actinotalea sp. K2]MCL3861463.1 methyltransferase domain-containing protein [Actinotalea sp. K2]
MDTADWDERYAAAAPWGKQPNRWVRQHTQDLPPGRALDLASGDGRHALWLAARGWQVEAVDFSREALARGRAEASSLPTSSPDGRPVGTVRWTAADLTTHTPAPASVDLVVVAYLHLPEPALRSVLGRAADALAPGGTIVVVGHDERNLAEGVGGPQDPAVLTDPDRVVAALSTAGLDVTLAQVADRPVEGATRPALDTVVVATAPGPRSRVE